MDVLGGPHRDIGEGLSQACAATVSTTSYAAYVTRVTYSSEKEYEGYVCSSFTLKLGIFMNSLPYTVVRSRFISFGYVMLKKLITV